MTIDPERVNQPHESPFLLTVNHGGTFTLHPDTATNLEMRMSDPSQFEPHPNEKFAAAGVRVLKVQEAEVPTPIQTLIACLGGIYESATLVIGAQGVLHHPHDLRSLTGEVYCWGGGGVTVVRDVDGQEIVQFPLDTTQFSVVMPGESHGVELTAEGQPAHLLGVKFRMENVLAVETALRLLERMQL